MIDSEIFFELEQIAKHIGKGLATVRLHARHGWLKTTQRAGVRGPRVKFVDANKWIALHYPRKGPIKSSFQTTDLEQHTNDIIIEVAKLLIENEEAPDQAQIIPKLKPALARRLESIGGISREIKLTIDQDGLRPALAEALKSMIEGLKIESLTLLDSNQACAMLGVTPRQLRKIDIDMIDLGGREQRWTLKDLKNYIENRRVRAH